MFQGLTWEEAIRRCPEGVVPACHNSKNTVTISGDAEAVHDFVRELKEEQKFAKLVDTDGVAFHSHHMSGVAASLKAELSKVSSVLSRLFYS